MAQIKIYADTAKGCIFFEGSTVEPKFLGIVNCNLFTEDPSRLVITRIDREDSEGNPRRLFKRLNPDRVQNQAGENLVADLGYSVTDVCDYINAENAKTGTTTQTVDTNVSALNFLRDETMTTIMLSNGAEFGINAVQADHLRERRWQHC